MTLLHDDIPGYGLPTIDFVQTTTDQDEDVSILEEDNSQIYAHLDNVLVHMIDNQQTVIFKLNQNFNKNKEKISQYIKYAENWQVASVICSYTAMACDVLLIIAMIVFLLKYCKTDSKGRCTDQNCLLYMSCISKTTCFPVNCAPHSL